MLLSPHIWIMPSRVAAFVRESNLIEGIDRDPTEEEIAATDEFLRLYLIDTQALIRLVHIYAPGHQLRTQRGLDVRVGNYIAPLGGKQIPQRLDVILSEINHGGVDPWRGHFNYEMLHPFTDGNGRSGRALWAWHMLKIALDPFALPFLHRFYYQTLENSR